MSAEQQQELLDEAERRAEELRELQDRAVAVLTLILGTSLLSALPKLRKAYRGYLAALQGETNGREAAKRLAEIQAAAAAFANNRDMRRLEAELSSVLKAAAEHGSKYAVSMGTIQGMAIGDRVPIPDDLINARLTGLIGAVRFQTTAFRDVITSVVADGAARQVGPKRLERLLIEAYRGAQQPDGTIIKRGLVQRVGVELATEVSVSSAQSSIQQARAMGGEYVRWITATDERVCAWCNSRHGKIYLADRITVPAHPRCRCGLAVVDPEQVQTTGDRRDDVLDAPFWQQEERRAVLAYADANNYSEQDARRRLAEHLNRPTAAERLRYPGIEQAVQPVYSPPAYDPDTTDVPGL